jgi:hypothetical protein
MKCHSICRESSLNIEKYEANIFQENFKASVEEITPFVAIVNSSKSRFVISQNLVSTTSYFTFVTGEKFASTNSTFTSSSFFFKSSIHIYQTDFSTLISISRLNQSLSISVIYKSLFKISTQAGKVISAAVTTQPFFFDNLSHSTQTSLFLITKSFRFNIISRILSFTHGKVEYS